MGKYNIDKYGKEEFNAFESNTGLLQNNIALVHRQVITKKLGIG